MAGALHAAPKAGAAEDSAAARNTASAAWASSRYRPLRPHANRVEAVVNRLGVGVERGPGAVGNGAVAGLGGGDDRGLAGQVGVGSDPASTNWIAAEMILSSMATDITDTPSCLRIA